MIELHPDLDWTRLAIDFPVHIHRLLVHLCMCRPPQEQVSGCSLPSRFAPSVLHIAQLGRETGTPYRVRCGHKPFVDRQHPSRCRTSTGSC